MTSHDIQKAASAAFFEDWSEWAHLDDLPPRTRAPGYYCPLPHDHNRYRCTLVHRIPWMGGAGFVVELPPNHPIVMMIKRVPERRQHPALVSIHRQAYSGLANTWYVPAHRWRELREALPAIKQAVVAWSRRMS